MGFQHQQDATKEYEQTERGPERMGRLDAHPFQHPQTAQQGRRELDVRGALQRTPGIDAGAIDVIVERNQVTLAGSVPDPQQRQFAHQVRRFCAGCG